MRILLFITAFLFLSFRPTGSLVVKEGFSPLSSFSSDWDKPEYQACNTAVNTDYLSDAEKNIIYILNLARMNPPLFAETVVRAYPAYTGRTSLSGSDYFRSLLVFLKNQSPKPLLFPEDKLYESAKCHAETSGESGYIGHKRRTRDCKNVQAFLGECCHYGYQDPLSIVMSLLIDEGVPSLGHRIILFKPHTQIGVSLQPHKTYRWNTVLDLG